MTGIIEEVENFFGSEMKEAATWVEDEEGNLKRTAVAIYHRSDNVLHKITAYLDEKAKSIDAAMTPASLIETMKTEMVKLF